MPRLLDRRNRVTYDEEAELARYVWNHFAHLLSAFEQQVGRAVLAREKAVASSNPAMSRRLSERWGQAGDSRVEATLSAGPEAFRLAVRRRVLAERGSEVIINRCPCCRRVVRTPTARQCFWCGHDWHGSDA
jgi:hypothetical protein